MLPFLFAAPAVQAGDSVTWMLFHDAVLMAVDGVGKTLVALATPSDSVGMPPCVRGAWIGGGFA